MSLEQGPKLTRLFKNWKFALDQTEEAKSDGGEERAEGTKQLLMGPTCRNHVLAWTRVASRGSNSRT